MPNFALGADAPTDGLSRWRVTKKMKPNQRGAVKLGRLYGQKLLCVRYRESPDGAERLTTVELIVERSIIEKRNDPVVAFKLKQHEIELKKWAMAKGAKYDGKTHMWKLSRREVLRMGLRSRIAVPLDQIFQEQIQP